MFEHGTSRVAVVGAVAAAVSCLLLASAGAAAASAPAATFAVGGGRLLQEQRRHGHTLRAAAGSFPDYLDPQLSYTLDGWTAMYDTYVPLLTYRHANGKAGSEVIPGLARTLPEITDGGRTYTLYLRRGLRYSSGQTVRASDFKFAVERMFRLNSGGYPFYTDIVGAKRFQKTKRGGVGGIVTDDRTSKIVIHLVKPRGTFSNELALMFVVPLPPGTPNRDMSADPAPGTGPYAIARSQPGRGWEYERNPYWLRNNAKLMPDIPGGHVGRIEVTVIRNGATQVRGVERGRFDWIFSRPLIDPFAELKNKDAGTQFRVEPMLNTYYFWMNTSKPPFDDLEVRQAVNYAVDSSVLRKIYAEQLAPSQQILPAGMPGYEKFELYPHDMAKAKRMIAEANPSDRNITVWAAGEAPNYEASVYYRKLLQRLGFKAELKTLGIYGYFTVIGSASTPDLDTGWGNWFEDYPHPNDFFQPLLAAESILPTNNTNWSRIADPVLSGKIRRLGAEPLGLEQEAGYATLDREYMEQAPWAPYGTLTAPIFVSDAIDLDKVIFNPTFGQDLTSFRFK
jgi:peptide/nickel transport system substrate-binding protein